MLKRLLVFGLICLRVGTGAAADPSSPRSVEVAAYDHILKSVRPGQKTVELGDMVLAVETVQLWREQLADTASPNSASQSGINKWTGGNVFYAFNANVSAAHRAHFLDAAAEWATFANLNFIARSAEPNYIMVNDGGPALVGGNSAVGMIGGAQQLNIGSSSWNRGTLVHEIGHALGLIHEHQRSDRDTYVTINFSNVAGGMSNGNFFLIPTSTNNGAYDFLSVMHYGRKTLALNPAIDTITPKPAYMQFLDLMGNNPDRVLSRGDRDGIAIIYGARPALATVVTNTKDSGAGTLRAAIYRAFDIATDTPGATPTISFQIPVGDPAFSSGVFTITPTDRLPAPGTGTTVDATTQTLFTGDTNTSGPEVVLNGALQVSPDTYGLGLRLSAANCTVKGLVINGFSTQGILITGAEATGNIVAGCYIGTNAAGTAASPNTFAGIEINAGATGNRVGGATTDARNIISGNSAQGVFIRGAGTNGNIVEGNFLGLRANGGAALANGFAGIEIAEGAQNNRIGGTALGAMNVISGNTFQGMNINAAHNNMVLGNRIGTNSAGTLAVANGGAGVGIFGGAQLNTIGGTTVAARNILSGNTNQGVAISGAGTTNNVVLGNYAGLNAAGTAAIPNGTPAARFAGADIFGGATNNIIGGTAPGSANVFSGNSGQGVVISGTGTSNNVVAGNFIGTNPTGTSAIANGTSSFRYSGVGIFGGATANIVGGTASGAGNIISGNTGQGVYIANAGTNNNVLAGNVIGLNAVGGAAVRNEWSGIEIGGGAQGTTVGGATAAARNVISGNQLQGVNLNGAGTSNNVIAGNYIGTNAVGSGAIGNGYPGVEIYSSASANLIGGAAPGAGNVISGNGFRNVTIAGANSNILAGNLIGLNAAGSAAVVNAGPGIQIFGGAQSNTIGSMNGGRNFIAGNNGAGMTISDPGTNGNVVVGNSIGSTPSGTIVANTDQGIALFNGPQGNTIGGSTPGAANLIAGNATNGVTIFDATTTGNRISGNSTFGNGGIGINIEGGTQNAPRVTTNDAGDGDTGPSNLQNYPVLTSAVLGTATTVQGSLNSTANTTFRIEFFASTTADPSGFGEGQNFIGVIDVSTNGTGNATFSTPLAAIVAGGQRISATATDPAGNSSEFSQNVTVTTTDSDGDGLPNSYEIANGLLVNLADANLDADGDGMTNGQEFKAGTDPRNSAAILRLPPPIISGSDALLNLPSLAGLIYRLEFADDLVLLNHWRTLADQIAGSGAAIVITDPSAASLPQRFYRALVLP